MKTATFTLEYSQAELLELVGAKLRGRNRADCPWCGGRRTISYTNDVFFCHRCGAKGNNFGLASKLGLARRLSPAEARALGLERAHAEAAAGAFLARVQAARFGLSALHIELLNLRDQAHGRLQTNPGDDLAWGALAYSHDRLPKLRGALLLLSEGTFGDRKAWLEADEDARQEMMDGILLLGGVPTYDGKFVQLDDPVIPQNSLNTSKR